MLFLDTEKFEQLTANPDYNIYGQKLEIVETLPTKQIQVVCSNADVSRTMESDTLESFFSHPKYVGVEDHSALLSIDKKTNLKNLPVFVVTYATSKGKYGESQPLLT